MRFVLIGFVAGGMALQMQATLVPVWQPFGILLLCLLLVVIARRRPTIACSSMPV